MLKRAHKGTFHKISPKHLQRYVSEFAGKHNVRESGTLAQMRNRLLPGSSGATSSTATSSRTTGFRRVPGRKGSVRPNSALASFSGVAPTRFHLRIELGTVIHLTLLLEQDGIPRHLADFPDLENPSPSLLYSLYVPAGSIAGYKESLDAPIHFD